LEGVLPYQKRQLSENFYPTNLHIFSFRNNIKPWRKQLYYSNQFFTRN